MLDEVELRAIDAAVVGHCEWLEAQGVVFQTQPQALEAIEVVSVMQLNKSYSFPRGGFYRLQLARTRLGGVTRDPGAWLKSRRVRLKRREAATYLAPRMVLDIVIEGLRRLCALRTRSRLSEIRLRRLQEAEARLTSASEAEQRQARLLRVTYDDQHIQRVEVPLNQLQERLGTASKRLSEFTGSLASNHATFVAEGLERLSGAPMQMAMARRLVALAEHLDHEIEFFRRTIQGAAAAPLSGHVGPADSKAWHRLRREVLLWLKQARAHYRLPEKLFPDPLPARRANVDARKRAARARNEAIRRAKAVIKSKT
jgi:hypothetical protein